TTRDRLFLLAPMVDDANLPSGFASALTVVDLDTMAIISTRYIDGSVGTLIPLPLSTTGLRTSCPRLLATPTRRSVPSRWRTQRSRRDLIHPAGHSRAGPLPGVPG